MVSCALNVPIARVATVGVRVFNTLSTVWQWVHRSMGGTNGIVGVLLNSFFKEVLAPRFSICSLSAWATRYPEFFFNTVIGQKLPDSYHTDAFSFPPKSLSTLLDRRFRMFDSINKDEDRISIGRQLSGLIF